MSQIKKATGQTVTKESDTKSIPIDEQRINQTKVARELATTVQQAGLNCQVATELEVVK